MSFIRAFWRPSGHKQVETITNNKVGYIIPT